MPSPTSDGANTTIVPEQRTVPFWPKLAYGFGAVSYGVKENGFAYFLLLFYSQVLGLKAGLVGLALMIALIVDAISDPIVGYISDNFRSKWGRRHPFMYAAAIPASASFYFLWNPPTDLSQGQMFAYLLTLAIIIRTATTFYETPSSALTPEFTSDYDERSRLQSSRFFFGWTGGNVMTVAMYFLIFPAFVTQMIPDGRFNPEAYKLYGLICAAAMFISIIVSTLGTQSEVKHLIKSQGEKSKASFSTLLKQVKGIFSFRSFRVLFISSLFGSVAAGLSSSMSFYLSIFFWGFSSVQIGLLTMGVFISAILGSVLAPIATKRLGKRNGAVIIGLIAFLAYPIPIALRLLGLLPPNGDPFIFNLVFVVTTLDLGLIICYQILIASMMADLVEQTQTKSGTRTEGLITSSITFSQKAVTGFGVLISSIILGLAKFPEGATPDQVPAEAIYKLGLYYAPILVVLWLSMVFFMSRYDVTRASHEGTIDSLSTR